MALGDIVRTMQPTPVVIYRKLKSGETPVAGDPVGFDSSGDILKAVNTTDGPLGMLSTHSETHSSVAYKQVLIWGVGIMKAGGTVVINKFVVVDSASKFAEATTAISTAFVQSEIQQFYRILGMYLGKEADPETNGYAWNNAAVNNLGMVFVGRNP